MAATEKLTNLEKICTSSGIALGTVAVICGVKPSTLGAARQGAVKLSPVMEDTLTETADRLSILKVMFAPLQLPADANDLRRRIRSFEDGVFSPNDVGEFKGKVGL